MADVTVRDNLPELRAELEKFRQDVQLRAIRNGTRSATAAFRRHVVAAAPQRTGRLRAAIYVARSKHRGDGLEHFYLGVRSGKKAKGRDAFYWRFLEGGWVPRGRGKAFRGGERTRRLARERAVAGGAKRVQYPFIAPGFERGKADALRAFYQTAEKTLRKYTK